MATVQGEEQKRIGELIRQQRKNEKMTQTELGKALGVGMQAVSDYEKGKVKVIPFEKRVKLAGILDIPIAELLYSDEQTDRGVRNIANEFMDTYPMQGENVDKLIEILKVAPVETFKNHVLEASKGLYLGDAFSFVLKSVYNNKLYYNDKYALTEILDRIFDKYESSKAEYKINGYDVGTLIACITDLYMEIIQERKGSANDTAQQ